MDSDFMRFFQNSFAQSGLDTLCFDFGYRVLGRKAPAPKRQLQEEFRAVVNHFTAGFEGPLFLAGKSMGGRITSSIAGEFPQVDGLIFLGFPLHAPGRPGVERAVHLLELPLPMFFVSGERDALARTDLLQQTVKRLGKKATLLLLPRADHSLRVSRSRPEETWTSVSASAVAWMRRIANQKGTG